MGFFFFFHCQISIFTIKYLFVFFFYETPVSVIKVPNCVTNTMLDMTPTKQQFILYNNKLQLKMTNTEFMHFMEYSLFLPLENSIRKK